MSEPLRINSRIIIPGTDLRWTAVRAQGPGGQNVNKVASKVELYFNLEGCQVLSPESKARLAVLAGHRLSASGEVAITSQLTRRQQQNLEDARAKLATLIAQALVVPKRRKPTKPSRGSKERRLSAKRHTAERKQGRSGVGRSGAGRRGDDG